MKPKFGEIWLADLGWAAKTRPVIIISRDDPEPPRNLFIYIPITSQNRKSNYEVFLGHISCLSDKSVANIQGIGSLPKTRFEKKLGQLQKGAIRNIKNKIFKSHVISAS